MGRAGTGEGFCPPGVVPGPAPSVLLEIDYYVYGPGTGFTTPELNITLNNRDFDMPVTLFLYWKNRMTGETRYYSLRTRDFGSQERQRHQDRPGLHPAAARFGPVLLLQREQHRDAGQGAQRLQPARLQHLLGVLRRHHQPEFTLIVTDTQTGDVKSYSNASGHFADPVLDTHAFATCP